MSVYKRIHRALSRSAFLHKVIKMNIVHIFPVDCFAPFPFLLACPPLPLPHGKYDVDGPSSLLPGVSSNHKLKGRRPKPCLQEKLHLITKVESSPIFKKFMPASQAIDSRCLTAQSSAILFVVKPICE